MEKYTNAILSSTGRPVVGAVVSVSTYPERTPATIYESLGGAAVSSVKSDRQGNFGFYAPNGSYSLTITAAGIATQVIDDIEIYDPTDDVFREQALQKAAEAEQRASALLSQVDQAQIVVQQTASQATDARDRAVTAAEEAKLSSSTATYLTYAAMAADTSRPVNTQGRVTNDGDSAKNGYYVWNGATWILSGIQPASATVLASTAKDARQAVQAASLRNRPRGKKNIGGLLLGLGPIQAHVATIQKRPRGRSSQNGMSVMCGDTVVAQLGSQPVDSTLGMRVSAVEAEVDGLSASVAALTFSEAPAPSAPIFLTADVEANQVVVYDGSAKRQLTAAGSVWRAPVVEGANIVRCLGDKDGAMQAYQVFPNGHLFKSTDRVLLHKVVTGQSLSEGSRGFVIKPDGKYLIQDGIRGDLFTNGIPEEYEGYCLSLAGGPRPIGWENSTAFEPIHEYANGVSGETPSSTWALAMRKWFVQNTNMNPRFLVSISSRGGSPYELLKKGTVYYANALAHVSKAKEIAATMGLKHVVHSMMIAHGESQENTTQAQYVAIMNEWTSDYRADIMAITGQAVPPMCFLGQMSGSGPLVTPQIQLAQLEAHETNPFICLIGPKYIHPYFDAYHMLAEGYVKQGEYEARAERFYLQGKKWQPLKPVSVARTGVNVKITYNNDVHGDARTAGPIGRLVIDEVLLSNPGGWGFTVPGVTVTAASVGPEGNTVNLTLSAEPAPGAAISYALQPLLNQPNNGNGRRGNIRDSDTRDMSRFDNKYLFNWSVAFSKPLAA